MTKYKTIGYWREREARLVGLLDRANPAEKPLVEQAIADVRALIAKRFPSEAQTHSEAVR